MEKGKPGLAGRHGIILKFGGIFHVRDQVRHLLPGHGLPQRGRLTYGCIFTRRSATAVVAGKRWSIPDGTDNFGEAVR